MHGDGIGPEIVPPRWPSPTRPPPDRDSESIGGNCLFGAAAIDTHGTPIPDQTLDALSGMDLGIPRPHDSAAYPGGFAADLTPGGVIRKQFDLFANLRPSRALPGSPHRHRHPDRAGELRRPVRRPQHGRRRQGVHALPTSLSVGVITRAATERIAREAFRGARAGDCTSPSCTRPACSG